MAMDRELVLAPVLESETETEMETEKEMERALELDLEMETVWEMDLEMETALELETERVMALELDLEVTVEASEWVVLCVVAAKNMPRDPNPPRSPTQREPFPICDPNS